MEYDVTIDRNLYIGGSDISVIMGISPFKTRYQLLLEKAGLAESEFTGNRYTVYGHKIEPLIREYINTKYNTNFEPNRVINGDMRCHSDGFNGVCILEIKSTSTICETVEEYKVYLVQLVKYMEQNKVTKGMLCVYERPEDLSLVFDASRLHIYEIDIKDYQTLLEEVNTEIERFRADLKRLKENPLLTEQDFQPNELVRLSNKIAVLENRMADYKALEDEYKVMKQALFEAMQTHNVKSWTTPNGTKITRVDSIPASVEQVKQFDENAFAIENPELHTQYCKMVNEKKAGKSGYVKITLPKSVT